MGIFSTAVVHHILVVLVLLYYSYIVLWYCIFYFVMICDEIILHYVAIYMICKLYVSIYLKLAVSHCQNTDWNKYDDRLMKAVERGEVDKVAAVLSKKGIIPTKLDVEGRSA